MTLVTVAAVLLGAVLLPPSKPTAPAVADAAGALPPDGAPEAEAGTTEGAAASAAACDDDEAGDRIIVTSLLWWRSAMTAEGPDGPSSTVSKGAGRRGGRDPTSSSSLSPCALLVSESRVAATSS